jgi:hypothetical protein
MLLAGQEMQAAPQALQERCKVRYGMASLWWRGSLSSEASRSARVRDGKDAVVSCPVIRARQDFAQYLGLFKFQTSRQVSRVHRILQGLAV